MSDVILCNLSDANEVIEEARNNWINDVLVSLGVSEEIIQTANIRKFRHEVADGLGIEVELKTNGEVDVYKKRWNNSELEELQGWLPIKKEHLIAQWKEPKRIRKVEGQDVYYEIHLDEWSAVRKQ